MPSGFKRFRHYRRTLSTAVVVVSVVGTMAITTTGVGTATAADDASSGMASAIAQSYKINPTAAALSIGISFGTSLADYTNQVARAESRAIDLGIIGTTMAAEGCDGGAPTLTADKQPQGLRADSRQAGDDKGKTEQEQWAPMITKSARADSTPSSEADTTSFPLGDGKTLTMNGAHSKAATRLVDGKTREALATADVGELDIAGVVHASHLHWEALHHTGADQAVKGVFTIGALTVNGTAVPTADPSAALDAANTALANLGVQIQPPKSHVDAGIMFVDPLAVAVVPSSTRDTLTGTVINGGQPVRQPLYDAILQASCKFSTFITVTDILVGSITGSGSFALQLGGVQATTASLTLSHAFGEIAPFTESLGNTSTVETIPAAPSTSFDSSAPSSSFSGSSGSSNPATFSTQPPSTEAATTKPAAPAKTETARAKPASSVTGKRAGALAAVAAIGLGLLLAMAEGDRRMMRRAQRTIPVEA